MIDLENWRAMGNLSPVLEHEIFSVISRNQHKETVLLVHGFPTFSYDWAPIWNRLSQHYDLLTMDMLGFGWSAKPYPHHYSIHEQADLIAAFMQEAHPAPCHILAHDYGDTVVQELLARHNDQSLSFDIQSVCFLNGGLFPETHKALLIQKLLLSPLGPLINRLTSKKQFDKSFSRVFGLRTKPSEEQLQEFWDAINHNKGRHIFHSLITYMRDRRENRQRWIDAIADFSGPVALINGSYDPVSGAHMVERFKVLLGEPAFLREYALIGHYPQLEAPDQLATDYLEFLSRQ